MKWFLILLIAFPCSVFGQRQEILEEIVGWSLKLNQSESSDDAIWHYKIYSFPKYDDYLVARQHGEEGAVHYFSLANYESCPGQGCVYIVMTDSEGMLKIQLYTKDSKAYLSRVNFMDLSKLDFKDKWIEYKIQYFAEYKK